MGSRDSCPGAMRTRDLDEAIDAVSQVYCAHTVTVAGRSRDVDVRLAVKCPTHQPIVELSYDAPVMVDAGRFQDLFLMMHCARGAARTTQNGTTAEWHRGQTMPFSSGCETTLWFDASFAQQGLRLDMEKLEAQCARWLGHPLDRPLRFALQPFSARLERAWQLSMAFLQSDDGNLLAFSPAGQSAFDEYLLTLLLHHHPHNYSAEMENPMLGPVPGLVRQAERFMADNAESPITVSDVAHHLGISLRTLQGGFRIWRNSTPSSYLRQVRLRRIREALLHPGENDTVSTTALRFGFTHMGRFSAYYRETFAEEPRTTLRRARASR